MLKRLSIQSKLKLLIAATCGVALSLSCVALMTREFVMIRTWKVRQLASLADVLALNSSAAIVFHQTGSAEELLETLRNYPSVDHAYLFSSEGELCAAYQRDTEITHQPKPPTIHGYRFLGNGYVDVSLPIREGDEILGSILLHANLREIRHQLFQTIVIALAIIGASLGIAILITSRLQQVISHPILDLATTAQRISREGDYSIRVEPRSHDEIGVLYSEFNQMLNRIERGESQLRKARDELEGRVHKRTEQLSSANSQLQEQMTERELSNKKLEESNRFVNLLQNIAVAANEAEEIGTAAQAALDYICKHMNWPLGHVYVISDESNGQLVSTPNWYMDNLDEFQKLRSFIQSTGEAPRKGLAARVFECRRPIWVDNLAKEFEALSIPKRLLAGLGCAFALPVTNRSRVVAVLEFFGREPSTADQRLYDVAINVGNQIGHVYERKQARMEQEELHRQLVAASHKAGKAEIATGVLHNVGNVLNSVNVSTHVILELLRDSKSASLPRVNQLLDTHRNDLGRFFTTEERGKTLPSYLKKLTQAILEEQSKARDEINNLIAHIEHIKTIVATQQSYAGTVGIEEPVSVVTLMEDAERLIATSFQRHRIRITREYESIPDVLIEKQKVLQIIVNLLKNAKDSVVSHRMENRLVDLRISKRGNDRVRIEVSENGVGIPNENMARIFSHGFTTKSDGHGFGLHMCANAAIEMDGSLSAASDGPGTGATFILELPLKPAKIMA